MDKFGGLQLLIRGHRKTLLAKGTLVDLPLIRGVTGSILQRNTPGL